MQLLTPHCQHLTELSIDSGLKDIPENFLASITRLEKLKGLSLLRSGAIADYATLQSISQMTTLRDLTLEVSLDRNSESVALLPLGGAFLGLHRLHLSGKIADLRRVFEVCECPRLSKLALSISGRTMVDSLLDGLAAICGRLPTSLIDLAMSISAKISGLETRTPVPSQIPGLMRVTTQRASALDILRPFLAFRALESVSIALEHYAPRLSDADARAFAHAWPALARFAFSCERPALALLSRTARSITLAGLAAFARGCPRLAALSLPVLDIRAALAPSPLGEGHGQTALRALAVHEFLGGREADLFAVALALDVLFPSVGGRPGREASADGSILCDVLDDAFDFDCQPARVVMLLVSAMWTRRQHDRKIVGADGGNAVL